VKFATAGEEPMAIGLISFMEQLNFVVLLKALNVQSMNSLLIFSIFILIYIFNYIAFNDNNEKNSLLFRSFANEKKGAKRIITG